MKHQGYVKIESAALTELLAKAETAVRQRKTADLRAFADKWNAASWWQRLWFVEGSPVEYSNLLIRSMCGRLTRIERLRTAATAGDVWVDVDEYGAIVYWADGWQVVRVDA